MVYFNTSTRSEPDPLPGNLFNTRPDPILKNPTRWALSGWLLELMTELTNKQKWTFKFPQPDLERRHSNEQVLFYTFFGEVFPLLWNLNLLRYINWEKARKPLSDGRKWADFLPCYHVTDLISEQVSLFRLGHQKCPFWEWEKATFTAFPHFRKGTSGARNENPVPVLKSGLWHGNMVRNLFTFGHW